MKARSPVALVAVVVAFAACASGGSKSSSSASSSGQGTVTTASSQNVAADKALATAALWKLSDFPTGWTAKPQTQDSSDKKFVAMLANCVGGSSTFFQSTASGAESPEFDDTNNNSAYEDVDYYSTAGDLASKFALLKSANFPTCLANTFNSFVKEEIAHPSSSTDTLPKNASIGKATVAAMSFPALGDESVAYRVTVPITYQGFNVDIYADLIAARKGRAVTSMTFTSALNGFDTSMEEQLANLAVSRLTGQ